MSSLPQFSSVMVEINWLLHSDQNLSPWQVGVKILSPALRTASQSRREDFLSWTSTFVDAVFSVLRSLKHNFSSQLSALLNHQAPQLFVSSTCLFSPYLVTVESPERQRHTGSVWRNRLQQECLCNRFTFTTNPQVHWTDVNIKWRFRLKAPLKQSRLLEPEMTISQTKAG